MPERKPLEETGPQTHFDKAHGDKPAHAGMEAGGEGISQKIEVDEKGNIYDDEVKIGKRFLKEEDKDD